MTVVLDASALLAYLQDEPGGAAIEGVLAEAVMSSANWAEVVQKSLAAGVVVEGMREDLEALGLEIVSFTPEDGEMAGRLWLQTRQAGLSLGDRACLSVGMRLDVPVLTCDRIWTTIGLALDVQVIR
ncbi:MAG: type II toxin-antitoxin system VapC family toxin [Oscillatoriophycideae cyanobacterium NC_groundwater_1537_Pr4_S-0.65um_50_18]|nr:type II toxin-antitoxin system VapC family toxin [Oscillatoriophycideae cyanobacterium NC_groundwater_1537_Pr4_S-0.65um_50_18]